MVQQAESHERFCFPDLLKDRGAYFDIRNLQPEELEQLDMQCMTDEEWEEFQRTGLSKLSDEQYDDFALSGKLPDDWDQDELECGENANGSLSYERFSRTSQQQQEDYLHAKKLLLPLQRTIQKHRQNCLAATAVIFSSSLLAGVVGVNQQNPLPMQVSMGGAAVAAIGIRSSARKKADQIQLNRQLRLLEEITTGYEFVHLTDADQQFYDDNDIPINVRTHSAHPVHALDSEVHLSLIHI